MSNAEQDEQKIIELLVGLEKSIDKPLKRFHNSVGISFRSMLDYVDEVIRSILPESVANIPVENKKALEDIQFLLQTYREMAVAFYAQYEHSLLGEIKNDQKLAETFPELLQDALDKLQKEWQRLEPLAVRSQTLIEDKKGFMRGLEVIADVSAYSVGLEAERVVVVPGTDFAMEFFKYLENFVVLTVPIDSVRAPWDWSIFWHELAGLKVRKLKKDTKIDSKIEGLYRLYNRLGDKSKANLLPLITRNGPVLSVSFKDSANNNNEKIGKEVLDHRKNVFGQRYLEKVFSKNGPDLSDLGSFEDQFVLISKNLSEEEKLSLKDVGWCADWFEELFEDAWSVMAIREPFLRLSEDFLRRKAAEGDRRHPPMKIRLTVARELLKLMNDGGEVELEPKSSVEERAAKQILKLISLVLAAAFNPKNVNQSVNLYIWPEIISGIVGEAIHNWSDFLDGNASTEDLNKYREETIHLFEMDDLADFISSLADPVKQEKNKPERSYEIMLKDKDYKELRALTFFERDFFHSKDIWGVEYHARSGVKKLFQNITADFIMPSNCSVEGKVGEITFWVGIGPNAKQYATQRAFWNQAFKDAKIIGYDIAE